MPCPGPHLPSELADSLLAMVDDGRSRDALVHLRCPHCQWRKLLLLPRASPREPKLERMLPAVPVRHWVFSLGESAQCRLVTQSRLRTRVARACVAAVFAWQRRVAAREGLTGPTRCGAVTAVHRVGATLEANVHVHSLVLDGVYVHEPGGPPVFHPLPAPRRADLRRMLAELRRSIDELLARARPSAPPSPPVVTRARTCQAHRVANVDGRIDGRLDARRPPAAPQGEALIQRAGELDVRAGPVVDPEDRALRSRLCRYVARPPFDPSALAPGSDGRLRYRLHHPFADGTTHVELSPHVLAERLHALAAGELRPPVAFHGVLAPHAAAKAMGTPARQLSVFGGPGGFLDPPRRGSRSCSRTPSLRCPRCHRTMEVVGVEPALPFRAA